MGHPTKKHEAEELPSNPTDENVRAVARIQGRAVEERTFAQRMSDRVAGFAAHEWNVALHVVWFTVWIGLNVGLSPIEPFDPFPFSMLTTCVSLEAIFLTLFVLGSQSRLTQDSDRRSHLDLQVNLLSEQEMTMMLHMLKEVCEHLGLEKTIQSPAFQQLMKRTDVDQLAREIDEKIGSAPEGPGPGKQNRAS